MASGQPRDAWVAAGEKRAYEKGGEWHTLREMGILVAATVTWH
jgi:hypothetical protein